MSDTKALIERAEKLLLMHEHIHLEEANAVQLHHALSQACMEEISENWIASEEKRKHHRQAFYLSAEYLTGRMVFNNLFGMQVLDEARALLAARGVDL
ncbi:MAG: glycogen phosphorylase, partial [Clostridia bacterium]|nr:glycogen phosphorylase [Clostridia bacterium]